MQLDERIRAKPFKVWKLIVKSDRSGTVARENGNGKEVYRQQLEFTDFPLPEIMVYFTDNMIMLPTECRRPEPLSTPRYFLNTRLLPAA